MANLKKTNSPELSASAQWGSSRWRDTTRRWIVQRSPAPSRTRLCHDATTSHPSTDAVSVVWTTPCPCVSTAQQNASPKCWETDKSWADDASWLAHHEMLAKDRAHWSDRQCRSDRPKLDRSMTTAVAHVNNVQTYRWFYLKLSCECSSWADAMRWSWAAFGDFHLPNLLETRRARDAAPKAAFSCELRCSWDSQTFRVAALKPSMSWWTFDRSLEGSFLIILWDVKLFDEDPTRLTEKNIYKSALEFTIVGDEGVDQPIKCRRFHKTYANRLPFEVRYLVIALALLLEIEMEKKWWEFSHKNKRLFQFEINSVRLTVVLATVGVGRW